MKFKSFIGEDNTVKVDENFPSDEERELIFRFVGRHNDVPDSEYDEDELSMGIEVELEHTDCRQIAKGIAKDHLAEIPGTGNNDGYYSLLKKMESDAGIED